MVESQDTDVYLEAVEDAAKKRMGPQETGDESILGTRERQQQERHNGNSFKRNHDPHSNK